MFPVTSKPFLIHHHLPLLLSSSLSTPFPLSTQNKWITDEPTGQRAKLVCANWVGLLELMILEGLHKQPLKHLVAQIPSHSFNCVRLTYAIYMWMRHGDHSVGDTLRAFDLPEAIEGMAKHNPAFLNLSHVQAFEVVAREPGAQKVMVLLDNHVSEPNRGCSDDEKCQIPKIIGPNR